MMPSWRSCQPVDQTPAIDAQARREIGPPSRGPTSSHRCTHDIEAGATSYKSSGPISFRMLSVDVVRTLGALYSKRRMLSTRRIYKCVQALAGSQPTLPPQVQADAQSAGTTKSALRMNRWASSCPIAKPSLFLIEACVLPRAERGNVAWSRLYFVGY